MKEHKSHMSMVARFAYIFATIVTVFAQMGAAVPVMIASADTIANTSGMTVTDISTFPSEKANISTHVLEISGPDEPANLSTFKINILGSIVNLDSTNTARLNKATMTGTDHSLLGNIVSFVGNIFGVSNSGTQKVVPGWIVTKDSDSTISVKRDNNYKGAGTDPNSKDTSITTHTQWPMFVAVVVDSNVSSGLQVDGSDTPTVISEKNTLGLTNTNGTNGTTYHVGDEIDLKVSDQNMIDGGEVDAVKESVSKYLTFDANKTDTLLQSQGYTKTTATAADVSKYADDAASASTISKYTKGSQYFYLLNNNGDAHIVWPPSDAKSERTASIATNAVAANSALTLTPTYLSGFLKGKDGTGVTLNIQPVPYVDATTLTLDPQSVAPQNGKAYRISSFPLFYMTENDDSNNPLYSFIYDNNSRTVDQKPTNSLENLRKGILGGAALSAITGGAGSVSHDTAASFENFHQINKDTGDIVAGTEKKFDVGKTYTLMPYDPVQGTTTRFKRISPTSIYDGKNFYMPDGIPQISLDSSGNLTKVTSGDGNAVPGQWVANGKQLGVNLYHVKKVQVLDQHDQPVKNATLTMTNASGKSISMHGATDADGNPGILYPSDNPNSDDSQPFYYAAGDEQFSKLDLPDGYTQDVNFSALKLNTSTDVLTVAGGKNATISDDGQTLILKVWKTSALDHEVNIKKVSKDDGSALSGAKFTVEETGNTTNDGWQTPAGTTLTSGTDGMIPGIDVNKDSSALTRTFHITETSAPKGYEIMAPKGYYATWEKGEGFTAVGTTEDDQAATSPDGLVSIDKGTLVIADSSLLFPGGSKADLSIRYVNAAGTPIAGAQLPVLSDTATYSGTGNLGMSGLGGIIYTPGATDTSNFKKADSGIVAGTGVAHDSIMYTSDQKSDANGLGTVQGLWSQLGISNNWNQLDQKSNAYKLSSAIVNGTIPTDPVIAYSLISPKQQQRAEGTPAADYYSLGGSIALGEAGGKLTVATQASGTNKFNAANKDNKVDPEATGNVAKVVLYKVKHIAITDVNGKAIVGATVRFTNLVTGEPTNSKGEAELVPADSTGKPTTSFAWPAGQQHLVSAKDASGNDLALGSNPTQWAMEILYPAANDVLSANGVSNPNISISDGTTNADHAKGQYVEMKTTTAQTKTVVRIHKQSAFNADKPVSDVTFKVWPANQDISTAVTTDPTDKNGDTTATFNTASTTGQYNIQEQTLPQTVYYKQDTDTHTFTADAAGNVSGVKANDNVISPDSDGVLHFADTPNGGGGGVGDNGTNGGVLTLKKVDLDNVAATVPDGAQFSLTEVDTSGSIATTMTVKNGVATADLGEPINATRTFAIQETTAPTDYAKNSTVYHLQIDKDGKMTLGGKDDANPTADHTADNVIHFTSDTDHSLVYGDHLAPKTASFAIKKVDAADRSKAITTGLNGTYFNATEIKLNGNVDLGSYPLTDSGSTATITTGASDTDSHLVQIQEHGSPTGYQGNDKTYYVVVSSSKGVTGVSDTYDTSAAKAASGDGYVSMVDKNTVSFADNKTTNSFSIKKTDASDGTTPVSGTAVFHVTLLDPVTKQSTSDAYDVTVKDGAVVSTTMKDQSVTDGTFSIQETTSPDKYDKEKDIMYFKWNSTSGVTAVASSGNATVNFNKTTALGNAGKLALSIAPGGVLNFSDVKSAATGPVLTVKKVATGTTQGLAGAKFTVTDEGMGNGLGATLGSTVTPLSDSTGADGTQQFSVIPTPTGTQPIRIFKVVESQAPTGYLLNSTPTFVQWDSKNGVTSVADTGKAAQSLHSSSTIGTVVPLSGNTQGYVNIADKPDLYTISAVRRSATDTDGTAVGNVPVTLSDPSGKSGPPQTLTTDPSTGKVDVSPTDIQKALGLTASQMTGNVDVRLDVGDTGTLASPVARIVRFTFSGGTATPGFSVFGSVAPADNSNPLKVVDKMVQDSKATDYPQAAGNLVLLMRKDTIKAQAIDDSNTPGVMLPGVHFQITFTINGQDHVINYDPNGTGEAKRLSTDANGEIVLPDPNTLFGIKDLMTPNTTASVKIKQQDSLSGYALNSDEQKLTYTTGQGYTTTDYDTYENVTDGLMLTTLNGGIRSIDMIYHFFGGSSTTFYLTKKIQSLNLDSVPASMNFGKIAIQTYRKSHPLLNVSDDNQAVFDTSKIGLTDPNVATSEENGVMTAQVTQEGEYADGWSLGVAVGNLTSEDKMADTGANDVIQSGNINFANYPTVSKDDVDIADKTAGLTGHPSILLGNQNAQMMYKTGTDSSAGVYKVKMNVADVELAVPALAGNPNTNYQAPMTWTINDTPTQ